MTSWALITGATSGIGREFAHHFARQGHAIIATGTRAALLQSTVKELTVQYDVQAVAFVGDLSLAPMQEKLVALARQKELAVLVNNAGFAINRPFAAVEIADWLRMSHLHMDCLLRLTQALLPQLAAHGAGTIINVASDAAYLAVPNNAVYSGTKAFIRQFSHALYQELQAQNIYVQALCPGLTRTDLHPKMGMPRERQKNRGLLRWLEPAEVVAQSAKAQQKNKAICICSASTKLQIALLSHLPKRLYYALLRMMLPQKEDSQP